VNSNHFKPVPIDDEFSKKAYSLYLKRLDINKRFLLKEDVDAMKEWETKLDDEILNGTFSFFDKSVNILSQRTAEAKAYYTEILETPFEFTANETYQTDPDKKEWAKDKNALRDDWRRMLKYDVLSRIEDQLNIQEKALKDKDTSVVQKTFAELEKDSREKVKKRYDEWLKRIEQDDRDDRLSFYLNCLLNVYDPHSGYFPPKDKENFDIAMSGQLEGIGATLQEKDGYIKVVQIVPGSPSWKQGQLKEGDLIIKVAQGNDEPVDVVDMRLDNAVKLVRGKKGTTVKLTVKKPDNSIVVISIVRDVVIIEDTFAKSVVLDVPGGKGKIGYIYLPTFYADFNNLGGRRASTDVKKEIEKLKKENISSMIVDLRNDGGGSLLDAVDIAGYFIPKGPVVQVKARYGPPYIYDDKNPALDYDGPLLVMVNSYSASASEIFAAAIQDYGRGIIMGTPNTFGKGTVQRFFDLEAKQNNTADPGEVKLTIQKFYRINGGSTQMKGVTPDIVLPDVFGEIDRGEQEAEYPMAWSKIDAVNYTKWDRPLPVSDIAGATNKRIAGDPTFKLIQESAKRYAKMKDESLVNLNIEKYRAQQKTIKEEGKKYEKIGKDSTGLVIRLPLADLERMKQDSSAQARSTAWQKILAKDIYLYQAAQVMGDIEKRVK
jgi:carboxyl-terminal processing protease